MPADNQGGFRSEPCDLICECHVLPDQIGAASGSPSMSRALGTVIGERVCIKKRNSAQFRLFSNEAIRTISFGMDKNIWITDSGNIVLRFDGRKYVDPARRATKVGCVAVSVDGSVFVISGNDKGNPKLFRWNATNRSFDGIRNTTPELTDITDDGEPGSRRARRQACKERVDTPRYAAPRCRSAMKG